MKLKSVRLPEQEIPRPENANTQIKRRKFRYHYNRDRFDLLSSLISADNRLNSLS
jgi:hypothetical protein